MRIREFFEDPSSSLLWPPQLCCVGPNDPGGDHDHGLMNVGGSNQSNPGQKVMLFAGSRVRPEPLLRGDRGFGAGPSETKPGTPHGTSGDSRS